MLSKIKLFIILVGIMITTLTILPKAYASSSVTTESHQSRVLNRRMDYDVYFPPSYSSNTSKSYPVLYLLHGMGGSNRDFTRYGIQRIVDRVEAKEMIIIMPNGFNTFYVNGYQDDMQYETYFHEELMPHVESKYRIDTANGQNRAISGFSMGGYGATYYGFKYSDKFSAVYSISGALQVPRTVELSSVINRNNYPAFVMECGREDSLVYQMNVRFNQTLRTAGIPHEYIIRSGEHSLAFLTECLPKVIEFVSKHFKNTTTPEPTTPPQTLVYGDVSGDGVVDSIDYVLLRRYVLGQITEMPAQNWRIAADLNKDGVVNSLDYVILRRYILEIIDVLPI